MVARGLHSQRWLKPTKALALAVLVCSFVAVEVNGIFIPWNPWFWLAGYIGKLIHDKIKGNRSPAEWYEQCPHVFWPFQSDTGEVMSCSGAFHYFPRITKKGLAHVTARQMYPFTQHDTQHILVASFKTFFVSPGGAIQDKPEWSCWPADYARQPMSESNQAVCSSKICFPDRAWPTNAIINPFKENLASPYAEFTKHPKSEDCEVIRVLSMDQGMQGYYVQSTDNPIRWYRSGETEDYLMGEKRGKFVYRIRTEDEKRGCTPPTSVCRGRLLPDEDWVCATSNRYSAFIHLTENNHRNKWALGAYRLQRADLWVKIEPSFTDKDYTYHNFDSTLVYSIPDGPQTLRWISGHFGQTSGMVVEAVWGKWKERYHVFLERSPSVSVRSKGIAFLPGNPACVSV